MKCSITKKQNHFSGSVKSSKTSQVNKRIVIFVITPIYDKVVYILPTIPIPSAYSGYGLLHKWHSFHASNLSSNTFANKEIKGIKGNAHENITTKPYEMRISI